MKFTKVRNLQYSSPDNSIIDLLATCKEYGEIPMTLNLTNRENIHTINNGTEDIFLEQYCLTQTILPYIEPIEVVVIPSEITIRQTRLYLLNIELLDEVELLVAENRAWQIEWGYSSVVKRTNQLISAMQVALELTDEQIDEMFLEANKL